MQLHLYKTLWGFNGPLEQAIREALDADFQGIEGPAPEDAAARAALRGQLQDSGLDYIAEITTAGSYVPERRASLQQHLDSLQRKLDHSLGMDPRFITCLGGCDAWPEGQSLEFFGRAIEFADAAGLIISFETHRSRSLFNPWVTQRMVAQLPAMQLTCDFSHWCVVCERLMDTELDVIEAIAPHAHHIHARIGYEQGPQVPHPGAPEYAYALRAHQGWWEILMRAQQQRGMDTCTMTPEFGPDDYLHLAPFTREPVAELWDLNCWMADEERQHLKRFNNSKA